MSISDSELGSRPTQCWKEKGMTSVKLSLELKVLTASINTQTTLRFFSSVCPVHVTET